MIRGVLFGFVVSGTIACAVALAGATDACSTGARCCPSDSFCGKTQCGAIGSDCQCCKRPNGTDFRCCDGACPQCWSGGWGGLPVDP